MNLSIVIPSKKSENLVSCVRAIRACDPGHRIIVVDDGARDPETENEVPEVHWVHGEKPFIYSRNCNLGIKAAGQDDVLLLNDDALLQTMQGFTQMHTQLQNQPHFGIISAVTNMVGNVRQRPCNTGAVRHERVFLCFVCVIIARSTINKVGLLDERFDAYGSDDTDYSYRAIRAALRLGIYDGCYVEHDPHRSGLISTFRGDGPRTITEGQRIFREKWGHGVNWGQ